MSSRNCQQRNRGGSGVHNSKAAKGHRALFGLSAHKGILADPGSVCTGTYVGFSNTRFISLVSAGKNLGWYLLLLLPLLLAACSPSPEKAPVIGEAFVGPALVKIRADIPVQSATVAT